MNTILLLGWVSTILFTVCFIPQIVKMEKTKKVDDISFLFFFIQFIANIIALAYAILIHQVPLIVKYVAALGMLVVVIYYYFKFKK